MPASRAKSIPSGSLRRLFCRERRHCRVRELMAKGAGAAGSVEAARPMGGGVIADQNVVVMNAQRISCCARF
jgi:hypothetical protein